MKYRYLLHVMFLASFVHTEENKNSANLSAIIEALMHKKPKTIPRFRCVSLECLVDAGDLKFYWHSKAIKQDENLLDFSNPALIRKSKITVFIIAGYLSNKDRSWVRKTTGILNKRYDYDVVVVDWSTWSNLDYFTSASASKYVGIIIGKLLTNLHQNYAVPLDNFILLGFSLGAHASGFAAKKVKELTNQKLPLIIGLDPAGPIFSYKPQTERLSRDDAVQVRVLHCNADQNGINLACGTIDIWVNGGCFQPECKTGFFTNPLKSATYSVCSHLKCSKIFLEALSHPQTLIAKECPTKTACQKTGGTGNGKIYLDDLKTSRAGEYCLNTTERI